MAQNLLTVSYGGFALDSLGECSITSTSSKMVPQELGQKETRQLRIKVTCFEQSFDQNYNLIQQARAAFQQQNQELVVTTPETTLSDNSVVAGTVIYQRPAVIVSHDLPEDANSWGSFKQLITVLVEFEEDLTNPLVHLAATFQETGAVGGPLALGMVYGFKPSYRAEFYSKFRNLRERAAGVVTMTGEIFMGLGDTAGSADTRRATLAAQAAALKAQINGRDGLLTYGLAGSTSFFSKIVRVQSFDPDVNQALNGITYSLTADYTEFPNEASYCAADIRVDRQEDREAGEKMIRLSGRIGAPNPSIANAKLSLLMTSVLANAATCDGDQAWVGLAPRSFVTNPRYVNSDDTQTLPSGAAQSASNPMGETNGDGTSASTSVFLEVEFNIEWRKKSANLLSWKLNIDTQDDAATGMQHVTYSGSVVASGTTADLAYAAASAQAAILGDRKYAFRMGSKLVRIDRYTDSAAPRPASYDPIVGSSVNGYVGSGIQENVECTFSYEYRVQGPRLYLEVTADVSTPTFGENGIRVSGFVVGQSYSAAQAFYVANVRNLYASKLILDESLSEAQDFIQGSALTPLASDGSTSNLFGRLSFSLTIWAPKTTGSFAVQYEMAVELDYTKLTQSTKLQGTLFASQVDIGKAENRTTGNVLDVFIATLHLGLPLNDSRTQAHDYLATNNDNQMALKFAQSFISVITNPTTLILQTEIQEEINYTGTRWSEFKTPDGVSVIQNTGIECGSRSVSGTVVAATETAGRTYVKNMIWSGSTAFMQAFPAGSTAPTTRYIRPPKISTKFVFIPLTQGVARGTGQNIQVVELAFSFSEILPAYSFNL